MVLKCCVPGCTMKGRFGFHKFPRDEENCWIWQQKVRKRNVSTKYLPFSQHRVCEKHFKEEDYVRSVNKKRLSKTSVPSVLVPGDESAYKEHSYVVLTHTGKNVSCDMCRQINVWIEFRIVLFRFIYFLSCPEKYKNYFFSPGYENRK